MNPVNTIVVILAYQSDFFSEAFSISGLKIGRISLVNTAAIVLASELHIVIVFANMEASTSPTIPIGKNVFVSVA